MKLKALFTSLALSLMVSVAFAADEKKADDAKPAEAKAADSKPAEAKKEDKVALKADASAELKAAYEAAEKENSAAKKAGFEWYLDDKNMSEILEGGVKAANEGKDEDAMKIFKKVEAAGKAGQEQAEKAKTAAPRI